ncbi:MAG: DNA/RNA nuclease SfsA [Oscillospiraceae bacterium]|nr:DNA/RNA nuclease SfsA [Oscillospiraceae bacterium]
MRYDNVVKGKFITRPNRFIAMVELDGQAEKCHVKNTGRCRELLTEGCTVYLERAKNPERKTRFDLIAVQKGDRFINMDSYAPNLAAGEFLPELFPGCTVRPEYTYGNSRFDFYIEYNSRRILLEVKGVTLESDGVVMFPDAPTERGVKHIGELMKCLGDGFEACLLFVIQMDKVKYFTPNDATHPEFGAILREAEKRGVNILAYDCMVTPDSMELDKPVEIRL